MHLQFIKWVFTGKLHKDLRDVASLDVSIEGRDVLVLQVQQHHHLSNLEILLHLSGQKVKGYRYAVMFKCKKYNSNGIIL